MEKIEQMLCGEISLAEYLQQVKEDSGLRTQLRELIPEEARYNSAHPLWHKRYYKGYEDVHFDLILYMRRLFDFDGSLGDNYNIFSTIARFYSYTHPDIPVTSRYEDAWDLYIDVGADYYDGKEVQDFLEEIIKTNLSVKPKTKRKQEVKKQIAEAYHIVDKKRPYWIQSPEWPMGVNSPMQYVECKKIDDGAIFVFCDFDTGNVREVVQYY